MKRFLSGRRVAAGVLFAVFLLAAWWMFQAEPNERRSPAASDANPVGRDEARLLYRRHCSSCHGRDGRGRGPAASVLDPPPRDFRSDTVARRTDGELFEVISEGRPRTGMPAWKGVLSEEERRALVRYLRRAFSREAGASRAGES